MPDRISPSKLLGPAKDFLFPRDGDRDLAFTGWQLSTARDCAQYTMSSSKCTEISLYITAKGPDDYGKIVTLIRRWYESPTGAKPTDESHEVAVHDSLEEALAWLKEDGGGSLRRLSKQAWVGACNAFPPFAHEAVEHI